MRLDSNECRFKFDSVEGQTDWIIWTSVRQIYQFFHISLRLPLIPNNGFIPVN